METLQLGEREIGGRVGQFNFSVPPEIGGTPAPRWAFDVTEGPDKGGRWMYQLDPELQGGRWEEAHHAQDDYEGYKTMPSSERIQHLEEKWGPEHPIALAIHTAAEMDLPFEGMVEMVRELNTHRQISE